MRVSRFLVLVVFVVSGGAALADEKIENPTYKSWSKFKVGTAVTLKNTTSSQAFSSESTVTMKLVEVTAEKVVVEMAITTKAGGMDIAVPPMKQEHAKMIDLPKGAKKEAFGTGKPEGTTKEGTETIKVSGQEIKARWYEYEVKAGGSEVKAKMWMSDDVPGSLVKMESKILKPVEATTTMVLTEIKKP